MRASSCREAAPRLRRSQPTDGPHPRPGASPACSPPPAARPVAARAGCGSMPPYPRCGSSWQARPLGSHIRQSSRQLTSSPEGVPIEIYTFTNTTEWVAYERIQSDIFDHLFAILPKFGLRVFQSGVIEAVAMKNLPFNQLDE